MYKEYQKLTQELKQLHKSIKIRKKRMNYLAFMASHSHIEHAEAYMEIIRELKPKYLEVIKLYEECHQKIKQTSKSWIA